MKRTVVVYSFIRQETENYCCYIAERCWIFGVCLVVLGTEPGLPILGRHSNVELLLDLGAHTF